LPVIEILNQFFPNFKFQGCNVGRRRILRHLRRQRSARPTEQKKKKKEKEKLILNR